MFGFRSDGRRLWGLDPIIQFTPYVMPTRADAQNFCKQCIDYDKMASYIHEKRKEGRTISFMTLVIAAYVRTVSQFPQINRFVVAKKIYARNRISVSFVVLRNAHGASFDEALIKLEFDPRDTIFDIADKIDKAVGDGRVPQKKNATVDFAKGLLATPGLPNFAMFLIRVLDYFGLLPNAVYTASPFHTSMFITNMASLNMSYLYHHLYNFGTTTQFLGLGKVEREVCPGPDNTVTFRSVLPIGAVTDERVCGGAVYAAAFMSIRKYLSDPRLLEVPPETVKWDYDFSKLYDKKRAEAKK